MGKLQIIEGKLAKIEGCACFPISREEEFWEPAPAPEEASPKSEYDSENSRGGGGKRRRRKSKKKKSKKRKSKKKKTRRRRKTRR